MEKKIKHYKLTKSDLIKLFNNEEIFFYNGNEIDIYFALSDDVKGEFKR